MVHSSYKETDIYIPLTMSKDKRKTLRHLEKSRNLSQFYGGEGLWEGNTFTLRNEWPEGRLEWHVSMSCVLDLYEPPHVYVDNKFVISVSTQY